MCTTIEIDKIIQQIEMGKISQASVQLIFKEKQQSPDWVTQFVFSFLFALSVTATNAQELPINRHYATPAVLIPPEEIENLFMGPRAVVDVRGDGLDDVVFTGSDSTKWHSVVPELHA